MGHVDLVVYTNRSLEFISNVITFRPGSLHPMTLSSSPMPASSEGVAFIMIIRFLGE